MGKIFDPFTPLNFGDLFTTMWVGAVLIVIGAVLVFNAAQRMYRRYPAILALHEWVFWAIVVSWGVVPLLVVVHVPLFLMLLIIVPATAVAVWATFVKFPPIIEAANVEIRRRRFVPPPRREVRERPKPTPAGRRRRHR
ncbi:MAG: hypothetical protein ABI978_02560 [Chloroflexota bacterium]